MGIRAALSGLWSGLWAMDPRELEQFARDLYGAQTDQEFHAGMYGATTTDIELYSVVDGVAQIPIQGVILKQVPNVMRWLGMQATSTTETALALETALADETVSEIEFYVDSPGGTVAGVQELADLIATSHKPTTSVISDIAASAAYWLGAQADHVVANPSALVGSIGVYRVMIDSSKAYRDEGLEVHLVRSGEHKGTGTPGAPISAAELAEEQRLINQVADMFIDSVAIGRGMTREQAGKLATGQAWFAADAERLGLIDEVNGSTVGVASTLTPEGDEEDLTMDGDDIGSANAALVEELESVKAELEAYKAEAQTAKVALVAFREAQKADLINAAIADGRVVPAMAKQIEGFAEACGDNVGQLKEFLEALPSQVRPEAQTVAPAADNRAELSDSDHAVCKLLGIEPNDFIKNGTWDALSHNGDPVKGVH